MSFFSKLLTPDFFENAFATVDAYSAAKSETEAALVDDGVIDEHEQQKIGFAAVNAYLKGRGWTAEIKPPLTYQPGLPVISGHYWCKYYDNNQLVNRLLEARVTEGGTMVLDNYGKPLGGFDQSLLGNCQWAGPLEPPKD